MTHHQVLGTEKVPRLIKRIRWATYDSRRLMYGVQTIHELLSYILVLAIYFLSPLDIKLVRPNSIS